MTNMFGSKLRRRQLTWNKPLHEKLSSLPSTSAQALCPHFWYTRQQHHGVLAVATIWGVDTQGCHIVKKESLMIVVTTRKKKYKYCWQILFISCLCFFFFFLLHALQGLLLVHPRKTFLFVYCVLNFFAYVSLHLKSLNIVRQIIIKKEKKNLIKQFLSLSCVPSSTSNAIFTGNFMTFSSSFNQYPFHLD